MAWSEAARDAAKKARQMNRVQWKGSGRFGVARIDPSKFTPATRVKLAKKLWAIRRGTSQLSPLSAGMVGMAAASSTAHRNTARRFNKLAK
ncbi:MAG: hypothetical protein NUV75_01350 [Gallionella sp.]|nr:hypothetical protein [Gallionella sp.]